MTHFEKAVEANSKLMDLAERVQELSESVAESLVGIRDAEDPSAEAMGARRALKKAMYLRGVNTEGMAPAEVYLAAAELLNKLAPVPEVAVDTSAADVK